MAKIPLTPFPIDIASPVFTALSLWEFEDQFRCE